MQKLVRNILSQEIPSFFQPSPGSPAHNRKGPAVFTSAINRNIREDTARMFAGTLRTTGYTGDIVVGVDVNAQPTLIEELKKWGTIRYPIDTVETKGDIPYYKFRHYEIPHSGPLGYSINVLRLYLYKWWSMMYDSDAMFLLADYSDLFFQSNPFTYKPELWMPPKAQLSVFLENFPQKMIYRCPSNAGWISTCYGDQVFEQIRRNIVSCSGTTMGTRDAILVYVSALLAVCNICTAFIAGFLNHVVLCRVVCVLMLSIGIPDDPADGPIGALARTRGS